MTIRARASSTRPTRMPRVLGAAATVLVALVAASCGTSSTGRSSGGSTTSVPGTTVTDHCTQPGLPTTVAYAHHVGVDANLTSLDVHAPARACDAPVVVWVHGGGYQVGDKAKQMTDKVRLFNGHGWILVSVNYRLTATGDPASAHYPDHYDDVATAVAWVHDHIAEYGGDPARLALLGHSAGADIVSNVADNPTYLARQHLGLDALRCAGPLDTEGFDKVAAGDPTGVGAQWKEALGNEPDYLTATSATRLVRAGAGIPPTIGVVRGAAKRRQIETDYLKALDSAGVSTTTIDAHGLTHEQVNSRIGAPGDTVMTPPLVQFLTACFAR